MRMFPVLSAPVVALLLASIPVPAAAQASLAPPPQPPTDPRQDRLTGQEKVNRAVVGAGVGFVGYHGIYQVGAAARDVIDVVPVVKDIPVYGSHLKDVPIIGSHVAKTVIPTQLGSAPFVGPVIKDIPVVGPAIAGPPHPLVVGAVAIDTYVLPKYAPCGWTESAIFTNTDFNSEPYLRQYVNYLAPLPYTHPPIYAPGPLSPGIGAPPRIDTVVPASAQTAPGVGTVQLEF